LPKIRIFSLLLTLCLLCACGEKPAERPDPTRTPDPKPTSVQTAEPTLTPAPASGSDLPASTPPASGPNLFPVPATPEPTEEPFDPVLKAQEPMGDELFADAAFFGNSLVDGLRLYGGLKQGDFYAATSASVVNVSMTRSATLQNGSAATLLEALAEKQYGKVYVLLGINEIGFETGYFIELYSGVLDQIAQCQPDAAIYIMSLTPVTKKKSDEGALFSIERVREYNAALQQLALDRGCWYVDLMDALQDADGYLAAADAADGVHMQPGKYRDWADYLRSHYDPKSV